MTAILAAVIATFGWGATVISDPHPAPMPQKAVVISSSIVPPAIHIVVK